MDTKEVSGDTKVGDALSHFYRQPGLGDKGGEDDRGAKVKMGHPYGWPLFLCPFFFLQKTPEISQDSLFRDS